MLKTSWLIANPFKCKTPLSISRKSDFNPHRSVLYFKILMCTHFYTRYISDQSLTLHFISLFTPPFFISVSRIVNTLTHVILINLHGFAIPFHLNPGPILHDRLSSFPPPDRLISNYRCSFFSLSSQFFFIILINLLLSEI